MKKKLNNPAIVAVICFMFFINSSFASFKNTDTAVCLKLNGLILKSPKEEPGLYKVELIHNNIVIDSNKITFNKPFEFSLAKNATYTVRITKQGFIPLSLKVDTKLTAENFNKYEFLFQTELHHNTDINNLDKNILNLPIGVIKYDVINNRFYPMESINTSLTCLKLNGVILKSPKKERGVYKVELWQDNIIIDSKTVAYNMPFEFSLTKNSWYTIRITKEGFVPLLISIDTQLKIKNPSIYEFNFQTELYHTSDVNNIDKDSFDLPFALVRFDESRNTFYPADDYRTHIAGSY